MKGSKMHKYELIAFWSEEDGRYVVEIPELPGCMADGETYEEAVLCIFQKTNGGK
jgi:predicted RNase H-like HicB family nuclease